ncbi:hypothetical protein AAFF_G00305790 [Aldrovandia affinis]|uniref:Uncharacterized protein n=1 Tax=Aldrovandia affinis TaxID=143900 RepID=A0AAD7WRI1_9TELE|nr:hypothetical protein AAFF_G00305790 [Aldrovandia affinis]
MTVERCAFISGNRGRGTARQMRCEARFPMRQTHPGSTAEAHLQYTVQVDLIASPRWYGCLEGKMGLNCGARRREKTFVDDGWTGASWPSVKIHRCVEDSVGGHATAALARTRWPAGSMLERMLHFPQMCAGISTTADP